MHEHISISTTGVLWYNVCIIMHVHVSMIEVYTNCILINTTGESSCLQVPATGCRGSGPLSRDAAQSETAHGQFQEGYCPHAHSGETLPPPSLPP